MSHRSTDGCEEHHPQTQVEFATRQPKEGSPETEFRRESDREFLRKFFNQQLRFPDGLEIEIWGFEDETSGRALPSPLLRAREGEIVHVLLKPGKSVHTIHHHGMEPDPRNDGVGHTSFEVTGSYTYQFRPDLGHPGDPNSGSAGTYFYHCHVNTVLHVQMGMFGPLIIDPPSGRGKAFIDDPVGYDPRAETLMVPFSVDPRWHNLKHSAGLDGEDVGLDRFEPRHFYLLGGNLNEAPADGVQICERVLVPTPGGRPGLLRVNNSSYFPTLIRFGGGLEADCVGHDGRPLRDTSRDPSPPVSVRTPLLAFGAAERYDLRLRPPADARPGDTFPLTVEFHHWVTNEIVGTATTVVEVIEPEQLPEEEPPGEGEPPADGGPPVEGDVPEPSAPGSPASGSGPGGGPATAPASPRRGRRPRRRRRRRRRRPVSRRRRRRRRRRPPRRRR